MTASRAILLANYSARDPFFSSVVQLAHFNGTNGSTTFTNSCPRGLTLSTVVGTAAISTAKSKFNGSSLLLPAGSAVINVSTTPDYVFGTGDYTVEYFANVSTSFPSAGWPIVDMRSAAGNVNSVYVGWEPGGVADFFLNGADRILSASGALTIGNWDFVAVSRVSGVTRMYVNGPQVGSSYTDSASYTGGQLRVGEMQTGSTPSVAVNVAELRITKGVGRYSGAGMTVPTAPFPNS